jgi:hypothetical protein
LSSHGKASICKKRNNNDAPIYAPSAKEGSRRTNDESSQPAQPTGIDGHEE